MTDLRYRDFSDLRAFRRALERLDLEVQSPIGPQRQTIEECRRLLRRNAFRIISRAPPSDIPLEEFLTSEAGDGFVLALGTFSTLVLTDSLHEYCAPLKEDPSFWRDICRWADYMCMFSLGIRVSELPSPKRKKLFAATNEAARLLRCIAYLDYSLSKAIIVSPEIPALRTAVSMYYALATKLYANGMHDAPRESFASECASIFPMLLHPFAIRGEQHIAAAAVRRIVGTDLRHLHHVAARHLLLLVVNHHEEPTMAVQLESHISFVWTMSFSLDLCIRPLPRCIVGALVEVLRMYYKKKSEKDKRAYSTAYSAMVDLCKLDGRTTVRALRRGLFPVLVSILRRNPDSDISEILHCVEAALVFRGALSALDEEIKLEDNKRFLHPRLLQMVNLASRREWDRKSADEDWERTARCSNALCMSPRTTPVRACPCAEALYCSKACQRLHWVDGDHRSECQRNAKSEVRISARDVHFIFRLVQKIVGITRPMGVGESRCAYAHLEIANEWPQPQIRPLEGGDPSNPRFVVDVDVPYSGWRTLTCVFRPIEVESQERFHLLTRGYTSEHRASK
ncbi:hypothetical protein K523DRAFT_289061 [Schizophyllum commune Tattone D]|nr:hypothetical protein K523DRAFT_289061 [Schizophyllum commune Tattone D]